MHDDDVAFLAGADRIAARYQDSRPRSQLKEHFQLERQLAARLLAASPEQRPGVYQEVYSELFRRLPHHPQHQRRNTDAAYIEKQMRVLTRFVRPGDVFLEVGAGDGRLAAAMAAHCARSIAVDVSDGAVGDTRRPANCEFLLIDGTHFGLPDGSVDFVYSNQLMEHLHPDDALVQLGEIVRILRPGGTYLCITPNALTGPHDISRYFSQSPQGFHLREYSYRDLAVLFRRAGFGRLRAGVMRGGLYAGRYPLPLVALAETAVAGLPAGLRARLKLSRLLRALLGVALFARKGA